MERTFTTQIDHILDYPVDAEITYEVTPSKKEGRHSSKSTYEITVTNTKYTSFGLEVFAEGKLWQRLEWIAQERAEDHFSDNGVAA